MDTVLHACLQGLTACLSSCGPLCELHCDCAAVLLAFSRMVPVPKALHEFQCCSQLAGLACCYQCQACTFQELAQCGLLLPVHDHTLM